MTTAIVRSNEILECDMWNDKGSVSITPLKINMEHNRGGLEDHFPFQMGDL